MVDDNVKGIAFGQVGGMDKQTVHSKSNLKQLDTPLGPGTI